MGLTEKEIIKILDLIKLAGNDDEIEQIRNKLKFMCI